MFGFILFRNIINIADCIVIPGNHDVGNRTQMDALTPIFKGITGKYKLHYLYKTGVYIYNNIAFGNSSFIDNKFIKASDILLTKNNKKIKIGY